MGGKERREQKGCERRRRGGEMKREHERGDKKIAPVERMQLGP